MGWCVCRFSCVKTKYTKPAHFFLPEGYVGFMQQSHSIYQPS
jgi:hypothetical protein